MEPEYIYVYIINFFHVSSFEIIFVYISEIVFIFTIILKLSSCQTKGLSEGPIFVELLEYQLENEIYSSPYWLQKQIFLLKKKTKQNLTL